MTVGDAYMAAGGLPSALADQAAVLAEVALAMRAAAARIGREEGLPLQPLQAGRKAGTRRRGAGRAAVPGVPGAGSVGRTRAWQPVTVPSRVRV